MPCIASNACSMCLYLCQLEPAHTHFDAAVTEALNSMHQHVGMQSLPPHSNFPAPMAEHSNFPAPMAEPCWYAIVQSLRQFANVQVSSASKPLDNLSEREALRCSVRMSMCAKKVKTQATK